LNLRRIAPLVACIVFAACTPQPHRGAAVTPTPSASPASTVPPLDITAQGSAEHPITIAQKRDNRIEYVLTALRSQGTAAQGVGSGTFYTATVVFYGRSGEKLTAKSPRALVSQADKEQTVRMVGGVIATTANGQTLRCNELTYGDGDKMLHGDGNVIVTGSNGMRLTGNHFDSDINLTNVQMR
jgi:hypothetical protein